LGRGAGDLLGAVVVAGGAADPVEDRRLGLVGHHGHVEPVGPVGAVDAGQVPRVAVDLHGLERVAELRRELALHHHEVPPHADDLVDVADHPRALLLARPAGGAGPEHVGCTTLPIRSTGLDTTAPSAAGVSVFAASPSFASASPSFGASPSAGGAP